MSNINVVLIKKSGLTVTFSDSSFGNTMLRIRESIKSVAYEAEHYGETHLAKIFISVDGDLNEYTVEEVERAAARAAGKKVPS